MEDSGFFKEVKDFVKVAVASLQLAHIAGHKIASHRTGEQEEARAKVSDIVGRLASIGWGETAWEVGMKFIDSCVRASEEGRQDMGVAYKMALGVSDALDGSDYVGPPDIAWAKMAVNAFWRKEKEADFQNPYFHTMIASGFPIREAVKNLPSDAWPELSAHYLSIFEDDPAFSGYEHAFKILATDEDRIALSKRMMDQTAKRYNDGALPLAVASRAMDMFHTLAGTIDGKHPKDRRELMGKLFAFAARASGKIVHQGEDGKLDAFQTERNAKGLSIMFETCVQGLSKEKHIYTLPFHNNSVAMDDFSEKRDGSQLCIVFHNAINYRGEREPMVYLKKDVTTLSAAQEHLQGVMKAVNEADPRMKKAKAQSAFLVRFKPS